MANPKCERLIGSLIRCGVVVSAAFSGYVAKIAEQVSALSNRVSVLEIRISKIALGE